MLNQRLAAAKAVAEQLIPAEASIEEALLRSSRLAIAIVQGRQDARLPITAGQETLQSLIKAQAALVDARASIADAHASLAEEKTRIGLGARMMGDLGECPEPKGQATAHTGLRVVS